MMRTRTLLGPASAAAGLLFIAAAPLGGAQAQTYQLLYSFPGKKNGANPFDSSLAQDSSGNLYGTTFVGNRHIDGGILFKVTPGGSESVLVRFDGSNGFGPEAGVIIDGAGNLYGTTDSGGAYDLGTVFEYTAGGTESVLYSFAGGSDGQDPQGGLTMDGSGNLYGTTSSGGATGNGAVFKLAPNGSESVIYSFAGGSDGSYPYASGVTFDASGNLYGTTYLGGNSGCGGGYGCGTVFKITPAGTESVLHAFAGGTGDGANPWSGVILDSAGNIYGTTSAGGKWNDGIAFKLAPDGTEKILHGFHGKEGSELVAPLTMDPGGNFYGAAAHGGSKGCPSGCGVVFELNSHGAETVLYSFAGRHAGDGSGPLGALLLDSAGNLYGTTDAGGTRNVGTVFEIAK